MAGVIGLLLSTTGPFVAMWLLLRRSPARDLGLVVCLVAAWGLGAGVSSLEWWVLGQVPDLSATTLIWLDTGIWTAAIALATRLPRASRQPAPHPSTGSGSPDLVKGQGRDLVGALAILLPIAGLAAVTFAARSYVAPHGEWDAWAIWNVRARAAFLNLPSAGAHTAVLPVLAHADYPELVPRAIARAWTFAGVDDVTVPVLLAAMFAGVSALLAGASIGRRSGARLGVLTAAFILASPVLVNWTWSQGADVPLSFFVLLTFVFTASAVTRKSAALWAFAGLSAGLSAWTKNEGIVFVIVAALICAFWTWRSRQSWRSSLLTFAAGAAPALLVLVAFKLNLVVANNLIAAQSLERTIGLLTWERFSMISQAMARELWFSGASLVGPLPLLGLFVAVNSRPRWIPEAGLTLQGIGMMLAAYALVYVLTPHDLAWHLRTSLDRLILHLMPSMVWAGMLLTGATKGLPGTCDRSSTKLRSPRAKSRRVQRATSEGWWALVDLCNLTRRPNIEEIC